MKDRLLNSCIRIENSRISRRLTIPRQVFFELTPQVIKEIEDIKVKDSSFSLETDRLTDIRYYALINSVLATEKDIYCSQSGLIFSSNYTSVDSQLQTTVVRSTIDSQGHISQEIQQDLWSNPKLSSRVTEAHYWLVQEILRQLPLKTHDRVRIFWLQRAIIAIALALLLWFVLPLSFLFKATIIIIGFILWEIYLNQLINKKIRLLILKQLSFGLFSQKNQRRKIGFRLLKLLT